MTTFVIKPPSGTTAKQAKAHVRQMVRMSDAESTQEPGEGIRSVEVHPSAVPDWENDCPCTFSTYVIQFADSSSCTIAFQRAYEADDYRAKIITQEEHEA
jgi:hypothetical protein